MPATLPEISRRASDLHFRSLVIDTHVDTTQRLFWDRCDLSALQPVGCVDIPRLHAGGIGAIFFAVWLPGTVTGPAAAQSAFGQIDAIRREVVSHPQDLRLARTAEDICRARREKKIAVVVAVEGGHMMNGNLDVLRSFAAQGVAYMTLTHALNTDWADSSTDTSIHHGLSPLGREVIAEMNRLGMIVDISHVSDQVFWQVLDITQAPVFASHSNCRAVCDSPRNLSDDMIRALAQRGGILQINFHAGFLSQAFRDAVVADPVSQKEIDTRVKAQCGENLACQMIVAERLTRDLVAQGKLPRVDWTDIIRHIDHAVNLVGADHIGLGSDFDGANMPFGMEDASSFPKITDALLARGYSESDIQKILGGNMLRLMQDVEIAASKMEVTP